MGQISKALGIGCQFSYGGQIYKLTSWKYRILGEFEVHLQEQAFRTMRRMRSYLTDEEYKDLVARTRRDVDMGVYSFGSPEVSRALDSRTNFEHLFYLCLRENHPEVTPELVAEMADGLGLEFMAERVSEANTDPTSPKSPTNTGSSDTGEKTL